MRFILHPIRFAAGDGIFCLPYGDGVVRASWIEDGQELLTVAFPAYGDAAEAAAQCQRRVEAAGAR